MNVFNRVNISQHVHQELQVQGLVEGDHDQVQQLLDRGRLVQAFNAAGCAEGNLEPRQFGVSVDDDVISYSDANGKVGSYIAGEPLVPERSYFEVEILDAGEGTKIGVGLTPVWSPLNVQPGWRRQSIGYHADDGRLYQGGGHGRPLGPKCSQGDILGCGIRFEHGRKDQQQATVYFTRNGKELGHVRCSLPARGFYPTIGLHSPRAEVLLNLDAIWEHKAVTFMAIDGLEEDWARLHDVFLNGQTLEYAGEGKSIMDVGLAQTRNPIDTTNHYFEIEIIDPGENCFIAIGLARKDYPSKRHPGWNRGSIAYHADDGKIFLGGGLGDEFGPKCHTGDTMGCGVLFPVDYDCELDSDASPDFSPDSYDEQNGFHAQWNDDNDEPNPYSGSSDDDFEQVDFGWQQNGHFVNRKVLHQGTRVQVFFTRNGKVLGKRDMHIPHGGFYPTIGMMSCGEKVRVDLRPLTG